MKKILDKNYLSVLFFGAVMTALAVFSAFTYTGLIEDGTHHFFEALTCRNFLLGHEGFAHFPYNLRYFPNFLSHTSVGVAVHWFNCVGIRNLLYLFTFISYFKFVIFIVIIYLNLPQGKKNNFEMILLSFLACFTFMSYQVWTENLPAGLFVWILFAAIYYSRFEELTLFNKICMVVFSFMLISSHQMVVVFIPVLFAAAVIKHLKSGRLGLSTQITLFSTYIFFVAALLFNFFYMLSFKKRVIAYASPSSFFTDSGFVMFCLALLVVLIISFFKNDKKYEFPKYFITALTAFFIMRFLLFNIPTQGNFATILLGFYGPLFFLTLIIFADFLKIKIEYKYIRIINLTLCMLIYLNGLHYAFAWKRYLGNIDKYITDNKKITIKFEDKKSHIYPILSKTGDPAQIFPGEYRTKHFGYILYILLFMQDLFDKYDFKDFISLQTPESYGFADPKHPTVFLYAREKTL